MSRIWQAGDQIPQRYHDLGGEVTTPPLNLSCLTRTQRNNLALSMYKDVIADSLYAIDHSPAAHVRYVLAGIFGDYNRKQVTQIEQGSHNRTMAMLHDYCGQSLIVQSGLVHLLPAEVAKTYLEKIDGHKTWRQVALEYCGDYDGFKQFTKGRFMDNLPKLEFESKNELVEKFKCLYGYGEKDESEAYTFVNGFHNIMPLWQRPGFNPYGPSGTTFSSDLTTTSVGLSVMTTIILGLQSSQSNYKHWASEKPNKEARFVSATAQKLASNTKRRQFFLLGVRHNILNISAIYGFLQFSLLYPLMSMENAYEASLVPGLMTLPCYHFLSTMKRKEQSISMSQMVRLMPSKLLHMVPLVCGVSLMVHYVNARRLFDAKLSLHYNVPHPLAGSEQNQELIEELIAKNDFYMEDPLESWKIGYLLGYKEIDQPESEGYWRRRPKQAVTMDAKLKYVNWLDAEVNALLTDDLYADSPYQRDLFKTNAVTSYLQKNESDTSESDHSSAAGDRRHGARVDQVNADFLWRVDVFYTAVNVDVFN